MEVDLLYCATCKGVRDHIDGKCCPCNGINNEPEPEPEPEPDPYIDLSIIGNCWKLNAWRINAWDQSDHDTQVFLDKSLKKPKGRKSFLSIQREDNHIKHSRRTLRLDAPLSITFLYTKRDSEDRLNEHYSWVTIEFTTLTTDESYIYLDDTYKASVFHQHTEVNWIRTFCNNGPHLDRRWPKLVKTGNTDGPIYEWYDGNKQDQIHAYNKTPEFEEDINRFYVSYEWKKFRANILDTRPNYCIVCLFEENLVIDHIKPLRYNWSKRLDPDNVQILCRRCNKEKGSNQTTWTPERHREALVMRNFNQSIKPNGDWANGCIKYSLPDVSWDICRKLHNDNLIEYKTTTLDGHDHRYIDWDPYVKEQNKILKDLNHRAYLLGISETPHNDNCTKND